MPVCWYADKLIYWNSARLTYWGAEMLKFWNDEIMKLCNHETMKSWNYEIKSGIGWCGLELAGKGWKRQEFVGICLNRVDYARIFLYLPKTRLVFSSFVPLYFLP